MRTAWRRWRRALLYFTVFFLLFTLIGWTLDFLIDHYGRPKFQKWVVEALPFPVSFSRLSMNWMGEIVVHDLETSFDEGRIRGKLTIPRLTVDLHLRNLLFKKTNLQRSVERVRFLNPSLRLASASAGNPGLSLSGHPAPLPMSFFPNAVWEMKEGRLEWEKESVFSLFQNFNLSIVPAKSEKWIIQFSTVAEDARGTFRGVGSFVPEGFQGRLYVKDWPIQTIQKILELGVTVKGRMNFEGTWSGPGFHLTGLKGKGKIENLGFSDGKIGTLEKGEGDFRVEGGRLILSDPGMRVIWEGAPFLLYGEASFLKRTTHLRLSSETLPVRGIFKVLLGKNHFWISKNPLTGGKGRLAGEWEGPWNHLRGKITLNFTNVETNLGMLDLVKGSFIGSPDGWESENLFIKAGSGKIMGSFFFPRRQENVEKKIDLQANDLPSAFLAQAFGFSGIGGSTDLQVLWTEKNKRFFGRVKGKIDFSSNDSRRKLLVEPVVLWDGEKISAEIQWNRRDAWKVLFVSEENRWRLDRLETSPKNSPLGRWRGEGFLSKERNGIWDLSVNASGIQIEKIPFVPRLSFGASGLFDMDFRLQKAFGPSRMHFRLVSNALSLSGKEAPFEAELDVSDGRCGIRKLTYGTLLRAEGIFSLRKDIAHNLQVSANGVPLSFLAGMMGLKSADVLQGTLYGNFLLGGNTVFPVVQGVLDIKKVQWGKWRADRLQMEVAPTKEGWELKNFRWTHGEHVSFCQGFVRRKEKTWTWNLKAELHRFPAVSSFFIDADWQGEGTANLDEPFRVQGRWSSSQMVLWQKNDRKAVFSPLSGKFQWEKNIGEVEANLASEISARFRWDLSLGKLLWDGNLQWAFSSRDTLVKTFPVLAASGVAIGKTTGNVRWAPDAQNETVLDGNVEVFETAWKSYHLPEIKGILRGKFSRLELNVSGKTDEGDFSVRGDIQGKHFWDDQAQLKLSGELEPHPIRSFFEKTTGLSLPLQGILKGKMVVSGTRKKPRVEVFWEGGEWKYKKVSLGNPQGKLEWGPGSVVFRDTVFQTKMGNFSINQLIFEEGSVKGETLCRLNVSWNHKRIGDKVLEFQGKLMNAKENPELLKGELHLFSLGPNRKKDILLSTFLKIGKDRVVFTALPAERKTLSGECLYSSEKWIFHQLQLKSGVSFIVLDGSWDAKNGGRLLLDADKIPLEEWFKSEKAQTFIRGEGRLRLQVEGTLEDPVAAGSFAVLNGSLGSLVFDAWQGEWKLRDHRLVLGTEELPIRLSRRGKTLFNVWGSIPFALKEGRWRDLKGEFLDIHAGMDGGDLSFLSALGLFKSAQGKSDLKLRITGTLAEPLINGDWTIEDGKLAPPVIAKALEDVQGRIKLRDNHMVIEDLKMRIGQGVVFVWTPPLEESRMEWDGFFPSYWDLRVRTVTDRGVLLNIPAIMRPGEYGEIHFYGSRREDPLLIVGPKEEPRVVGTALLDTGHYTFPPLKAVSESGEEITYKELADVRFELKLQAGKDCWYSNEFNTSYLEVKVNPGDFIWIEGRDADSTPERAGIQSRGSAESRLGYLRYLGREFRLEYAKLFIPKGEVPWMSGKAVDRIRNAEIPTAGGSYRTDVDIWVNFEGPFGNVDFKLDSNPKFAARDETAHQQILLSYLLFGRDMTGQNRSELEEAYRQQVGKAAEEVVLEALDRIASAQLTRQIRQITRQLGDLDVNIRTNLLRGGGASSGNVTSTPLEENAPVTDAQGNTLPGVTSLAEVELRKYLDPRLAVIGRVGVGQETETGKTSFQNRVGLEYWVNRDLSLNTMVGENPEGIPEKRLGFQFRKDLPNVKRPKKGDSTPPKIERWEARWIGDGKVIFSWQTDEVSRVEIMVMDEEGSPIRKIQGPSNYEYEGEYVLEGLKTGQIYRFQLLCRDLNGNTSNSSVQELESSQF